MLKSVPSFDIDVGLASAGEDLSLDPKVFFFPDCLRLFEAGHGWLILV